MLVQSFSGIRGVYGTDLTDDIARRYAHVFVEFLRQKLKREPLIVVGMDTRESGGALKKAIFASLVNIIDVGVMPVAAVELAVREYKADGGIMITASHNEPGFNGFKFLDKDGAVLRPKDIDHVIKEFGKENSIQETSIKNIIKKDVADRYAGFIQEIVGKIKNDKKIIIDVNGGTGIVLKEILDKLGVDNVKIINDKPGVFKRKIEPNGQSLKYLKDIMKDAEFAAGLDCDADRVEILLKDGSLVNGNYLLALIVDDLCKGTVVVNDATSNVVRRVVEKHKCSVKEVEVGEINVVDEMLRLKSSIGGEGSNGGVIIAPSRCRDGILSVFYLLKLMNKKGKSLSELIRELPRYFTIQEKVKSDEPIKMLKDRIKKYYVDKGFIIQETGDITGGLKVIIDKNNFVWFRASKTEPNLLRIIADSDSRVECNRMLAEALSVVKKQ